MEGLDSDSSYNNDRRELGNSCYFMMEQVAVTEGRPTMCDLSYFRMFSVFVSVLLVAFLSGCNSGSMSVSNPPPNGGMTSVVMLATSTGNDQLVQYRLGINSISLADESGSTVTLYTNSNPQGGTTGSIEFMHLNGVSEPIFTAQVPQGVYPAAIVVVGGCSFTTVTLTGMGGSEESTDAQGLCAQGTGQTTVNLPAPITISGATMALSLNLQVSQSYTLSPTGIPPPGYTFSPTFTLTPVKLAAPPTTNQNGKFVGINAVITLLNAMNNSFVAQIPDGFSLTVNSGGDTAYQGVAAFSTLAVGTLINMDVAIQPDASLLATRVEVDDLSSPMDATGPLILLGAQPGSFVTIPAEEQGCSIAGTPFCGSVFQYDNSTVFGLSSEYANLQNLPFTPSLTGPGLLYGQNLAIYTSGQFNSVNLQPASTAILEPQIINGSVTAVTTENNFTVYTVALASYDLIPILQGVTGPINRLTGPTNVVQVYVDANAQVLTSAPLNTGSLLRFRGLIFDDNGTLRMDCNVIRDGVAE
jgi:hypothetical protein